MLLIHRQWFQPLFEARQGRWLCDLHRPTTHRRVLVRVSLDDDGRVCDLKFQRSCGDPARDGRVLHAIAVKRFPT
ncbi:TonB C-terminal domain-containing protein [Burkholderia ambifaria]